MNWFKAFWKKLIARPPLGPTPQSQAASTPKTTTALAPASPTSDIPRASLRLAKRAPNPPAQDAMSNFTPRAQQVLALARKEADRFHHNFVGTEHLLLGLLRLGQGTAFDVMLKMGVDVEVVRREMEKQIGTGPDQKVFGNIPYTPRVRKVLAFAAKEAKALNHTYVGTEHILLGVLREGDGVAARVLRALNVDVERTRAEVLKHRQEAMEFSSVHIGSGSALATQESSGSHNFTPRAQRAFTIAREEAERRAQRFIETEHVLLGLIRLGSGVGANVLIKIGLNADTVAARIEDLATRGPAGKPEEAAAFSPLVKRVLSFALEEARRLDHTYVGTEHILLALLREPHGGAVQIFKDLYVDTDALRQEILTELNPNTSTQSPPAGIEKTPMQPNPAPGPISSRRLPVDTSLRYDVYCAERNQKIVVYRNVQFKAVRTLFPKSENDHTADFVELEQRDGQTIFLAKINIVRFCQHGVKPEPEES